MSTIYNENYIEKNKHDGNDFELRILFQSDIRVFIVLFIKYYVLIIVTLLMMNRRVVKAFYY